MPVLYRTYSPDAEAGQVPIFSSHSARAIFIRASWSRERLRRVAQRFSAGSATVAAFLLGLSRCNAIGVGYLRTGAGKTLSRIARRLASRAVVRRRMPALFRSRRPVYAPLPSRLCRFRGSGCTISMHKRVGRRLSAVQPSSGDRLVLIRIHQTLGSVNRVLRIDLAEGRRRIVHTELAKLLAPQQCLVLSRVTAGEQPVAWHAEVSAAFERK